MKKALFIASILLLGAGCTASAPKATAPNASNANETETPKEIEIVIDGQNNGSAVVVAADEPDTLKVDMTTGNFFFEPKTITAKPGQKVEITFSKNEGFHTIVIDELDFKAAIKADGTVSFVAPTKPGNYPIYCDVGSHRAKGMEAVLVVK